MKYAISGLQIKKEDATGNVLCTEIQIVKPQRSRSTTLPLLYNYKIFSRNRPTTAHLKH